MEEAKLRLSRGEAPTDDIEKEFKRAENLRIRREAEIMANQTKIEKSGNSNYINM